ncbi:aldehyde dehydrogenase family protein [Abyssibacter sp.]|uniref:aldehyde dehydrogenase family protein n=1 Tax=Abyssibacter sp. TaxID=2320200 RepID=UPI0035164FB7
MSTPAEKFTSRDTDPDISAIDSIFQAQQRTALEWRRSTAAERISRIKRLLALVQDNSERIYQAAYADFRKPETEVDISEIMPVVAEARKNIKKLKRWMKPMRVRPTATTLGTKAWVQHEPRGVSLIISPWNYPLNLSFMPLVSALGAGCPAIIKPSEMTPNMSALMRELIESAFDPSEVAVIEGDVRASQALLSLPFDHIFFTGSPAVGKIVMKAAAEHLTSVTLELGGKSPVIVDQTANVKRAAESIAWGKFCNNGQTCIAPDYLYVHESVHDEFVAAAAKQINTFYGDNPEASADYCRIVNERHHDRIHGLMQDAVNQGARLAHGGQSNDDERFIAPTLLTNVPKDARIMQEEIFGPLLPILTYRSLDDVLEHINANEKPLALYLFTKDKGTMQRVMSTTSAGSTGINTNMVQYLHGNLPFGGVNNSGIGNAHGHWGFKAFSHERSVVQDKFSMTKIFNPPYTDFVKKMVKLTVNHAA